MITTNDKVKVKPHLLNTENLWVVDKVDHSAGPAKVICTALMDAGEFQETQTEKFFAADLEKI